MKHSGIWGTPTKMSSGVGFVSGSAFAAYLYKLNIRWILVLLFYFILNLFVSEGQS